jgi:hypothetical protein
VIEGWTPGLDVVTQLSARFYGGLHRDGNRRDGYVKTRRSQVTASFAEPFRPMPHVMTLERAVPLVEECPAEAPA